jgi:hypothetical protein
MKSNAHVVGLGYCTLDYLTLVNKYPEIDTKEEVVDFLENGGGPTGTTLVTLVLAVLMGWQEHLPVRKLRNSSGLL